MIGKDENTEGFGATKPEAKATAKKGLVEKITDRVDQWRDTDVVVDGYPVSPATARLLREHPDAQFIGADAVQLFRLMKDGQPVGHWTPRRAGMNVGTWESKSTLREFVVVPDGLNHHDEIWLSLNGQTPTPVGHRIATNVLQRMQSNNALTEAGLRLLTEQIGAESAAEEAAVTK